MKSKLRNIVIDEKQFKYHLKEEFMSLDSGERIWVSTVRIFKNGYKNTPLTISFRNQDQYAIGNSLTSNEQTLNLHRPFVIEYLIRKGLELGWNTEEKSFSISDGMEVLKKAGFNLKTNNKS